ncbi:MAG: hypothetical protein H3C43_10215 [Leptonema sp. (in: Bacteria)]|nr:hypothetical protein [Leptonema sp. (in: bacteria)]
MKEFLLFISGLFVFSQPVLAEPLVFEVVLADAWSKCNFSQLPHGGKKGHVMLIGDSNGALYGAFGLQRADGNMEYSARRSDTGRYGLVAVMLLSGNM